MNLNDYKQLNTESAKFDATPLQRRIKRQYFKFNFQNKKQKNL